jgi:hypothetical protein
VSRGPVNRLPLTKVEQTPGCWPWHGIHDDQGYSKFDGYLVHRTLFEQRHGTLPAGITLDHLCQNKWCVNPDHLEPVSQGDNARRGNEMKEWRNRIRRFLETGRYESNAAAALRRYYEEKV